MIKHRFFTKNSAAVLALLCVPAVGHTQPPGAKAEAAVFPVQRLVRQVARGVEMVQEIVPDGNADGPLVITVLRIDPRAPGVRVEAALGQDRVWGNDPTFGREIVSKLAQRHKAVAGINAGFFPFAGNPIGLHMQDGEMVTEPAKERTVFLIPKDGKRAQFRAFAYKGTVQAGERVGAKVFPLSGLNRKADKSDSLLLYTPIFADQTLKAPGRVEIVLSDVKGKIAPNQDFTGKVESVGDNGGTSLARNTVVLSGAGDGATFLRSAPVGSTMTFRLEVTPSPGDETFDTSTIKEAVAGAPRILTKGKVTIRLKEESMGASFSTTRHPRTAVGQTPDGMLLFVTVDGRQKGLSRGASLPELAQILLKYGATDAVNLDGGGSSALIVRDRISSSPSEGVERPIANALLVYADDLPALPTSAAPIALAAPSRALTVGEIWPFTRSELTAQSGIWGTQGGVGFVNQKGEFRAMRPGKGEVRLSLPSGKSVSARVVVVGKSVSDAAGFAAKLALQPEANNRATLTVHIANAEGDPLAGEAVSVMVIGGKSESALVTTDRKGEAHVVITWDKTAGTRLVSVSSPAKRFAPANLSLNR